MYRFLAVLACLGLSACSIWPWSSNKNTIKPTPLASIDSRADLRVQWRSSVSASKDAPLRAAVVGDALYAAGADGKLARFELGKEVWRISAARRIVAGVSADATTVVVGSGDGEVLAFDAATGKQRWKVVVGGEPFGTPLIVNDMVVTRVGDNQLLAHALSDGSRRWIYQRTQAPLSLRGHSGMLKVDDKLVAGFAAGKLVSVALTTGLPRWEASVSIPKGSNEIERLADLVGDPVLRGDAICMAAFQGRVACVDATRGSLLWSRDISSPVGVDADARLLYITDDVGAVHALDMRTGASAWKQEKLLHRGVGRPLVFGDFVAVTDAEGWLHLLDTKDGRFVGRIELDGSGVAAPLLRQADRLLALARDGDLYAVSITPKP